MKITLEPMIINKGAKFSDCQKYRYGLWRIWDEGKPLATCIGLNPSTANTEEDDNTIRTLISMLTILGYGGFYMTNLFALISPHPEDLRSCPDPVKDNDKYLQLYRGKAQDMIFCWGSFPMADYRAKRIKKMFPGSKCFGKNANGSPFHPRALLYKKLNRVPELIPF